MRERDSHRSSGSRDAPDYYEFLLTDVTVAEMDGMDGIVPCQKVAGVRVRFLHTWRPN